MTTENAFLPFCIDFARLYKTLSDGEHISIDGFFMIQKKELIEYEKKVSTPTRVSSSDTGIFEIQNDLDYPYSGILFFLVWAFVKYKDIHQPDDLVDTKTLNLIQNAPNFLMKDFLVSFIKVMSIHPSEYNKLRVENVLPIEQRRYTEPS